MVATLSMIIARHSAAVANLSDRAFRQIASIPDDEGRSGPRGSSHRRSIQLGWNDPALIYIGGQYVFLRAAVDKRLPRGGMVSIPSLLLPATIATIRRHPGGKI